MLAAILNPPMYGNGAPRYLNYGAVGMVMGHEITHGFDDSGRQYDANGNVREWWTAETVAAFEEKAQCYDDQYDAICYEGIGCVSYNKHTNRQLRQSRVLHAKLALHKLECKVRSRTNGDVCL